MAERMLASTARSARYRYDQIEKIEVLDYEVDTFHLVCRPPLHQYVADGDSPELADILKIVLDPV